MLRRGWRNVFYTVLLLAGAAHAQAWKPLKHVELVSGSAAGAASDGVLRAVERLLQEKKLVEVTTAMERDQMENYFADQFKRVLAFVAGQPYGVVNPAALDVKRCSANKIECLLSVTQGPIHPAKSGCATAYFACGVSAATRVLRWSQPPNANTPEFDRNTVVNPNAVPTLPKNTGITTCVTLLSVL